MKLGLIGHPLGHSWSPEIHDYFIHQNYQLFDLNDAELDSFLKKKNFDGLNVTIPYKQTVIPYLDELDRNAEQIGAVNCIVSQGGKLKGYNTDCIGFAEMLKHHHIDVKGKHTAVLGSGGASKAVVTALKDLGGIPSVISRHKKEGVLTYEELYEKEEQFSVIVNTTPVGMFPQCDDIPVDLKKFHHLKSVVDIVANPLRTRLCFEAKSMGLQTCGGFEMLVRQAFVADELFLHQKLDSTMVPQCMNTLLKERRNIVLIGMPTSGKTTVSRELGKVLKKEPVEMDQEIEKKLGMSISECFAKKGEAYFRTIETEVAKDHRQGKGEIISCGGGVIKTPETMRYLSENGIVILITRNPDQLYPSGDRPLASSKEALKKLYEERKPLYERYRDVRVDNSGIINETIQEILKITGMEEEKR